MNSFLECTSAIHLDQGAVLKRISDLEATADEIRRNCQTNKECLENLASRILTIENRQGHTSVSLTSKCPSGLSASLNKSHSLTSVSIQKMQDEHSSINSEFQSINGIIACVDQETHNKSTFELGTDEETFG